MKREQHLSLFQPPYPEQQDFRCICREMCQRRQGVMLGKLSTRYLNDAPRLEHLKNRCNLWKNHRTDKNICACLPIWSKETSLSKHFFKSILFLCRIECCNSGGKSPWKPSATRMLFLWKKACCLLNRNLMFSQNLWAWQVFHEVNIYLSYHKVSTLFWA